MKVKRSYATRLREDYGLDLNALRVFQAERVNNYFKPVIDMIMDSDQVVADIASEWSYKSLYQFAVEEFSTDSPLPAMTEQLRVGARPLVDTAAFLDGAASQFGMNLKAWLYYIPEGIELYVPVGDGSFRPADERDASWQLVTTLIANDVDLDSRMVTPPQWSKDLYIWRRNYDAYCAVFHDIDLGNPLYEFSRKFRRDAIMAYTHGRLTEEGGGQDLPPELAIALAAFQAVSSDSDMTRKKTPKQALTAWLKTNHEGLSEGALERIATIANWQPSGGAPKQA